MRKILVPLDGSAFAEQAIETARAIAHRSGAAVEFLTVLHGALPPVRWAGAPPADTRLDAERRHAEQAYLDRIVQAERARSTFAVEGITREGDAAAEIVAQAADGGADLIAMTTHGRTGFGRLLFGSVAEHVVRHAEVPVLLLRQTEAGMAATPMAEAARRAGGERMT